MVGSRRSNVELKPTEIKFVCAKKYFAQNVLNYNIAVLEQDNCPTRILLILRYYRFRVFKN